MGSTFVSASHAPAGMCVCVVTKRPHKNRNSWQFSSCRDLKKSPAAFIIKI